MQKKGDINLRSDKRKTEDLDGLKYSPELIRQLSDPQYAKEEEQYEYQARRRSARHDKGRAARSRRPSREESMSMDDLLGDYIASGSGSSGDFGENKDSYEEYENAEGFDRDEDAYAYDGNADDAQDAGSRRARAKARRAKRSSDSKKKKENTRSTRKPWRETSSPLC